MFTPAQTLVTGTLVEEITNNPAEAVNAAAHMIVAPYASCEQTTVDYFTASSTVFQTCSDDGPATHFVEWVDDMGNDSMNMCTFHAAEYEKDAETDDHIVSYTVTKL
jgi:hypothetical protein